MNRAIIAGYQHENVFYAQDFDDFEDALTWLCDNLVDEEPAKTINAPHDDNEEIFAALKAAVPHSTWFCVVAGSHEERY